MINRAQSFAMLFIKNCRNIKNEKQKQQAIKILVEAFISDFKATYVLIQSGSVAVLCLQGYYQMWDQISTVLFIQYKQEVVTRNGFQELIKKLYPNIWKKYYLPNIKLIEK